MEGREDAAEARAEALAQTLSLAAWYRSVRPPLCNRADSGIRCRAFLLSKRVTMNDLSWGLLEVSHSNRLSNYKSHTCDNVPDVVHPMVFNRV